MATKDREPDRSYSTCKRGFKTVFEFSNLAPVQRMKFRQQTVGCFGLWQGFPFRNLLSKFLLSCAAYAVFRRSINAEFTERGQNRVVGNVQDTESFRFQLLQGVTCELTRKYSTAKGLMTRERQRNRHHCR